MLTEDQKFSRKQYHKKWVEENKEHMRAYYKQYRKDHHDKKILYDREYRKNHKKERMEYIRNRQKTDPAFSVLLRLRGRLKDLFRNNQVPKRFKSHYYGVDYKAIVNHLGSPPNNDWEKYSINHIIPLYYFDFNDNEQIRIAFLPENHEWQEREINIARKSYAVLSDVIKYFEQNYNGPNKYEIIKQLTEKHENNIFKDSKC